MSKSAANKFIRVYVTFAYGSVHGAYAGDVIEVTAAEAASIVAAGHGTMVLEAPHDVQSDLGQPGSEGMAEGDQPAVGEGGSPETPDDSEG